MVEIPTWGFLLTIALAFFAGMSVQKNKNNKR